MSKQKVVTDRYGIVKYEPTLFRDEYGDLWVGIVFVNCVLAVLFLSAACFVTATHFSIVTDRNACHTYGTATNREVKFVRFNFASDGCFYKAKSGQWIDTSNLVGIQNGN